MNTDVAALSMPAVEDELASLAGHLAAGTCRFLELLSAFDAGGGWQGRGMRTCAQWLSWRCGLSTGAAREQLRVARALDGLPKIRTAFAAGRISFSKARALTRVAAPATEADLLDTALAATASQLDRLCSGIARARTSAEVVEQSVRASFTARWESDGSLRFSGRLSAEHGAVLLAALAAVRVDPVLGSGGVDDPGTASGTSVPSDPTERAAHSDADALVLLAEHALSSPPLEVGSSPVRLVVHTSAEVLRGGDEPPSAEVLRDDGGPTSVEVPTAAVLDGGPGIPLLPLGRPTLRRLACEALVEWPPDPDGSQSRRPSHRFADARQRRALLRRDGGCVFPGCPRRRGLHAHHVVPWHQGGPTSMGNLALLCEHHHLLIHDGGWRLRRAPTGRWHANAPDGRTLVVAPATDGTTVELPTSHGAVVTSTTVSRAVTGEPLQVAYAVAVHLS